MPTITQNPSIIFEHAGAAMFRKRNADGTLSTDLNDILISAENTVKSVNFSISKETYDIENGNSPYPTDTRPKKIASTAKITYNAFDRKLYRFGTGAEYFNTATGAYFPVLGEKHTIGAGGTVTLQYTAKADGMLYVNGTDGTIYEKTAEPATAGKFTYATNALTFASADIGKTIEVSYEAAAVEVSSDVIGAIPVDNTYEVKLIGKAANIKGAAATKLDCITIDSAKFDGEISPPAKQNEAGEWTVNLKIVEPAGTQAVRWDYVDKTNLTAYSAG